MQCRNTITEEYRSVFGHQFHANLPVPYTVRAHHSLSGQHIPTKAARPSSPHQHFTNHALGIPTPGTGYRVPG
eukprot:3940003-Rhodomonas_salina.2